jgi:glycerophosphoryl diester phosphodiesterase
MTKLGHGDLGSRLKSTVHGIVERRHDRKGGGARARMIGHRGAPREAPENTRRSFACAIEQGATGVEVDVCRTKDGRFVLWHDPDPREKITIARDLGEGLAYVANEPAIGSSCRKPISEVTYAELLEHFGYTRRRDPISHILDGNTKPEVPPEPLESLMAFVDGEPRLRDVYVDVKLRADQVEDARALAAILADPRYHLLTTEREIVQALEPRVTGDFELPGVLEAARELGLRNVSMGAGQRLWVDFHHELCEVLDARDRGELDSVVVWTVNDEARLRDLVALGVDGIITDDLAALARAIAATRSRDGSAPSSSSP